jgi:hypothetical protein
MLANNMDTLPRRSQAVGAVDIDGKTLLLWSAGDRGGIRARVAPYAELASAPDVVLFDDHVKSGTQTDESTVLGFELHPTAHGALLLLSTVEGVYALAFDATGKLVPLTFKV